MSFSCVYPEDNLSSVRVDIAKSQGETANEAIFNADVKAPAPDNISECGFIISNFNSDEKKVTSLDNFSVRCDNTLYLKGVRAYVVIDGITVYSKYIGSKTN